MDEWSKYKNDMPFEQMPVVEVDGFKIPQSLASARYLARKFGYAGESLEESAIVDAFAEQFKDFYSATTGFYYTKLGYAHNDLDVEEKTKLDPSQRQAIIFGHQIFEEEQIRISG